jgi:3-phosphoshikimate 1-carboxyvinyltransferase
VAGKLKGLTYTMASAQVNPACCWRACMPKARPPSLSRRQPVITPSACCVVWLPGECQRPTASVESGHKLTATHIEVPGDISSSAFFLVAASIAEGSELLLEHVGINPTRTGVIDILRLMGATSPWKTSAKWAASRWPTCACGRLSKGIEIPEALVPLAIDEFPVLFVAAAVLKVVPCCVAPKSCGSRSRTASR